MERDVRSNNAGNGLEVTSRDVWMFDEKVHFLSSRLSRIFRSCFPPPCVKSLVGCFSSKLLASLRVVYFLSPFVNTVTLPICTGQKLIGLDAQLFQDRDSNRDLRVTPSPLD